MATSPVSPSSTAPERHKANMRANYHRFIDWLNDIKAASGCVECDERNPMFLHFDHVDPATKLFDISHGHTKARWKVVAEIAKTEVRCVIHHIKRTHAEGHSAFRKDPRTPEATPLELWSAE